MKTLKVGIASYADMKVRTMAIARGEYQPKRGEPRVWFTSMESFSRVLSDRNRKLLDLIAASATELPWPSRPSFPDEASPIFPGR